MNRRSLESSGRTDVDFPPGEVGVLQFGSGGFLRGFAEHFIQEAVRQGRFRGSVAVVGSTTSRAVEDLVRQDGLYTLIIRGRESGRIVDEERIMSVISRALAASGQWVDVLKLARDPDLKLIISNTTEVGIVLDESDRIDLNPPRSYPGKLTAVLFERAKSFDFDPERGLTVLPCELIEDNGDALRDIVLTLAERWDLGDEFASWMGRATRFCNTLVDRIVPGTPRGPTATEFERRLGYHDALLTVAEPYRLWAIEGDQAFARDFPLAGVDPGIVVADDIGPFRERKVRILNGTHTAIVPAAILAGFETIGEATQDAVFSRFIEQIVIHEIVPTLDSDSAPARQFADEVLERFSNPFIRHQLIDITFQQTRKLRVRLIPTLEAYAKRFGSLPPSLMLGLACFVLYNHPSHRTEGSPKDDASGRWEEIWAGRVPADAGDVGQVVETIARDDAIWGPLLGTIDGFVECLTSDIVDVASRGVRHVLASRLNPGEKRSGGVLR